MFICGSFHHQEDDDDTCSRAYSSPKKSRRSASFKIKDQSKNPYATRGLDKFDALLAELDDKKQKIYTQKGAEDITLVRFVYSNDNKIKPVVVVRVKEKKVQEKTSRNVELSEKAGNVQVQMEKRVDENQSSKPLSCDFKVEKLRQPFYYLPLVTLLILLFLAIYGRSFAIVCTSLGWYFMSTIKGGAGADSTLKKRKKKLGNINVVNNGLVLPKKEYTRRLSDKSVVSDGSFSPTSVMNGPMDVSPRQHGHRRSF